MQLWHKRNIARSPIHGRDPRKTVRCSTLSLGRRSVSCCPFPATGPGLALPDAKRQMSMPPRSVAQWLEHRSPKPGVGGSSPSTPASGFNNLRDRHPEQTECMDPSWTQSYSARGQWPASLNWRHRGGGYVEAMVAAIGLVYGGVYSVFPLRLDT